jgi:hypothetical protein
MTPPVHPQQSSDPRVDVLAAAIYDREVDGATRRVWDEARREHIEIPESWATMPRYYTDSFADQIRDDMRATAIAGLAALDVAHDRKGER